MKAECLTSILTKHPQADVEMYLSGSVNEVVITVNEDGTEVITLYKIEKKTV